jgi:hypothetical protein
MDEDSIAASRRFNISFACWILLHEREKYYYPSVMEEESASSGMEKYYSASNKKQEYSYLNTAEI